MGAIKKIKIFFGKLFDTPPEVDEIGIAYDPKVQEGSGPNVAIRKSGEGSGNAYVHQFWVNPNVVKNATKDIFIVNDPNRGFRNVPGKLSDSGAQAKFSGHFSNESTLKPNPNNNSFAYLNGNV